MKRVDLKAIASTKMTKHVNNPAMNLDEDAGFLNKQKANKRANLRRVPGKSL